METETIPAAPDEREGFFYSDVIPVRGSNVTTFLMKHEHDTQILYTPLYHCLSQLNEPIEFELLSGPLVRDIMSIFKMIKIMSLRPSSTCEMAPMIRCATMALSTDHDNYSRDPIIYRFIRNPSSVMAIKAIIQPKPTFNFDQCLMSATTADVFTALCNNSCVANEFFLYSDIDINWTAVSVFNEMKGQSYLISYIASFMTSDIWNGL